jgi:AraC-like DNA-binding protein/ligand-binding sensor domain-containing protein
MRYWFYASTSIRVRESILPLFLLLLLLGFIPAAAGSESFRVVQNWRASDGLPVDNLEHLTIDAQGQLWMASYDGAIRFQGFDFRVFNRDSQPALPSNRLTRVHAAPGGGVVVQMEDGRLGLLSENAYQPIGAGVQKQSLMFNQHLWFVRASDKTLWSWHPGTGAQQRSEIAITAMAHDRFGEQLLLASADGEVLAIHRHDAAPALVLNHAETPIQGLAGGPDDALLIIGEQTLFQYHLRENASKPLHITALDRAQIRHRTATWTENGWLIADLSSLQGGGPNLLDGSTLRQLPVAGVLSLYANRSPARLEQVDHQGRRWVNEGQQLRRDGEIVFASEDRIIDFLVDRHDQVWLAKPQRGLQLLKRPVVKALGTADGELADPNLSLVKAYEGDILVGSWTSLNQYDPARDAWSRLLSRAARDAIAEPPGLLVGTRGLCLLTAPEQCEPVSDFPAPRSEVLMLHRDANQRLWAGTERGLFIRDQQSRWQPSPIHTALARTALEETSGRLLFGTNGAGLLVVETVDTASPSIRQLTTADGLSSDFVRALLRLDNGEILVGTEDAGLCMLGPTLQVIGCLSTSDGLPHHSVHYMLADAAERIWINSNRGIHAVAQQALTDFLRGRASDTPSFQRLTQRHGLTSIEGNGGVYRAGARTADGRIWFPNQLGLVTLQPNEVFGESARPIPARIQSRDGTALASLELDRNTRHVDLELAAVALAEPSNVEFRYRLNQRDWTELGQLRQLSLQNLRPGQHQLEVAARYVDGEWTGRAATLAMDVHYRFYEHPLFRGTLWVLFVLVLLLAATLMRQRQRRLERMVKDRSQRLTEAKARVSDLAQSLERVDSQHRTALHAVSGELKSALKAVLEPLLQSHRGDQVSQGQGAQEAARNLAAMIDQIDSFSGTPLDDDDHPPETGQQAVAGGDNLLPPEEDAQPDILVLIRLEVMLHLADPEFNVDQLAQRLSMSRSVLYRRVGDVTNVSPAELIRDIRLEQAAALLQDSQEQVSSIAYATGFKSVSAFSRAFSKKMGCSPRLWREEQKK